MSSQAFETKCYWAPAPGAPLVPSTITRRAASANDVVIDIEYAGICHSDIHQARDEWKDNWGSLPFPMVPGHEIAGKVISVGSEVTKYKVGDKVGVGCMVDSCRKCTNCKMGEENYCFTGFTGTYASKFNYPHSPELGNFTYGGYSQAIVVDEAYVLKIPDNLDFSATAPLLCAGVTTYSPLIHFNLRPHHRFAVAGLGGLGHMGVKFGKAFGAHTTVLSRGSGKKDNALNELKADAFVDITDPEQLKAVAGTFDFILDTIAAEHDLSLYLNLLRLDGRMVCVGVPPEKLGVYMHQFIGGRKSLSGSLIGGIKETQDMLDFCGRNNITCDVEVIKGDYINEAYTRTLKSDVKYRFVIDVKSF